MARVVNLWLKANASDIEGEPETTFAEKDLSGSIECLAFRDAVTSSGETSTTTMRTGRRRYEPICFRKRVDKSTPLIQNALVQNQSVDARFEFRRHSTSGDGTVEHYFTIEATNGRVVSIRRENPDVWDATDAADRFNEWVCISFESITWTDENSGAMATDTWDMEG